MMPSEPDASPAPDAIRPLKEVWLRPRRVFRALAERPVGVPDYVLASILGIGNFQSVAIYYGLGDILRNSLVFGPITGVASAYLYAAIYARLGVRAGGNASRSAMFHVVAYGALPVVAALGIWALALILFGDSAFLAAPNEELDGFQALILYLRVLANFFLWVWSVVLQVMGFSELLGVTTGRALRLFVLGQLLWIGSLAAILLIIAVLFPGLLPATHA